VWDHKAVKRERDAGRCQPQNQKSLLYDHTAVLLTAALLPQTTGVSMMQVSSAVWYTFMPATRTGKSPRVKYFSAVHDTHQGDKHCRSKMTCHVAQV
jgi:hypothetical protein